MVSLSWFIITFGVLVVFFEFAAFKFKGCDNPKWFFCMLLTLMIGCMITLLYFVGKIWNLL